MHVGQPGMGDLSAAAMVTADIAGRNRPRGRGPAAQAAEIGFLAPGLADIGIPLDEFCPGNPLFETAHEALEY
jgi:hypothetical protein